tara:strand:+ start:1499 stop:1930 length:432 start_codon:yes stop_codon:yes gene_type:complete
MSAHKAFDRNLYAKADTRGKDVLSSWLIKNGHNITTTKENYNCDIVTEKNGVTHNTEVEIKFSWKGNWPDSWDEIRIPYRKNRLLVEDNLTFYVLRSDCKQAWAITADTLKNIATVKEASNKYIRKGEQFFHVPVQHAQLLDM